MDLDLTDAQKTLRDQARDLAAREIAPTAGEIDRLVRHLDEAIA